MQLTPYPSRLIDKMSVPPNLINTVNNAVYNGRHVDAVGMLRDLGYPFGFRGMRRITLALRCHRTRITIGFRIVIFIYVRQAPLN